MIKKIKFILFTSLLITFAANALAANACKIPPSSPYGQSVKGLIQSADQIECMSTRQNYKCDEKEKDLNADDKKKIIQCDRSSLDSNKLTDTSLVSCVWNGFKISGENLVDLVKLPGAIAEIAMKGFKETQECNKSLDKKRELLNAYNISMPDKRFKLEEKFLGNSFQDMPCSEIEKMVHARYDNFNQQIMREMMAAKLTNKPYKMPEQMDSSNSDLKKSLEQVFKEAGVAYNCYTPKAKAEMVCAGVTSLLADFALGAGVARAAGAVKAVVKSRSALARVEGAALAGEKANLADSAILRLSDRTKAAEAVLGRKLTKAEAEALKKAHEIGLAEGRGYFTYTAEDISNKARLLKEAGFSAEERRALMENGIAGAQGQVKPSGITFWHEQRIKGERLANDFATTGKREKLTEGMTEARKFYKQFLDNGDAKVLFTADRDGFSNLIRANEYGLTSKESATIFDRSFGKGAEAAANYKNAIGSINNQIRDYEAMIKANRGGNLSEMLEYKIYKARELRGRLIETYYERKYPNKYKELEWDNMDRREQDLLSRYREDIEKARAKIQKMKLPTETE